MMSVAVRNDIAGFCQGGTSFISCQENRSEFLKQWPTLPGGNDPEGLELPQV